MSVSKDITERIGEEMRDMEEKASLELALDAALHALETLTDKHIVELADAMTNVQRPYIQLADIGMVRAVVFNTGRVAEAGGMMTAAHDRLKSAISDTLSVIDLTREGE